MGNVVHINSYLRDKRGEKVEQIGAVDLPIPLLARVRFIGDNKHLYITFKTMDDLCNIVDKYLKGDLDQLFPNHSPSDLQGAKLDGVGLFSPIEDGVPIAVMLFSDSGHQASIINDVDDEN